MFLWLSGVLFPATVAEKETNHSCKIHLTKPEVVLARYRILACFLIHGVMNFGTPKP